jgi:hypothetical protein
MYIGKVAYTEILQAVSEAADAASMALDYADQAMDGIIKAKELLRTCALETYIYSADTD